MVLELAILALVGLAAGTALLRARARHANAAPAWREACERLGLDYTATALGGTLSGTLEGLDVLARGGAFQDGPYTRTGTDVQVSGGISTLLRANANDGFEYGRLYRAADVLSAGPQDAMAAAVLTPAVRNSLREKIEALDARIEQGAVRVMRPQVLTSADEIEALVRTTVSLARSLSVRGHATEKLLLERLQEEPLPDVRAHMLKLLLQCHAHTPEGARGMELAAASSDPAVQLLRARKLEGERFEILKPLATSDAIRSQYRVEAIAQLGELASDARVTGVLAQLLADRDASVRREVVRAVRRNRDLALVPALSSLAARAEPATARALVTCLDALGDARAEPGLIALLNRNDPALRPALIAALGRLGTVAAVEPLLLLAEAGNPAARNAVDAIQSRLGNVEAGRLSMVKPADAEGALSLARPAGGLSLADEDDER